MVARSVYACVWALGRGQWGLDSLELVRTPGAVSGGPPQTA